MARTRVSAESPTPARESPRREWLPEDSARRGVFRLLLLLAIAPASALAVEGPGRAAVASAHALATEAGMEAMRKGGNAFDAAVAVTAALGVVEPYSSGIGGGGFWLLHRASDGYQVVLDGREVAPAAARRDLYLDGSGRPVPRRSIDGPLAAAIPGVASGLARLANRYGRLPLAHSLAPAIRLAREGFRVSPGYRKAAAVRKSVLRASKAAAEVFLIDGEVPPLGHLIRQPDLARTLEALAERGAAGFYRGAVARRLVEEVGKAGGLWTVHDLERYRVVERAPVSGTYRGVRIVSAPPPSAGGIVLMEALNILEGFRLETLGRAVHKHLVVEALRRAYRDRALYLGDPDFVSMPLARLLDKRHAAAERKTLSLRRATPSAPAPAEPEAGNTSHFSVIDAEGNRVAATLSINYLFGSGFMVPGTGVLLNDEMDDFSLSPGLPNVYGLTSGSANAVAPGKRPLSSMTPTFIESADRVAILGTPGGSRITSMVLLATLDFVAGGGPYTWVSRPRFHHQYLPDRVEHEAGALDERERAGLRSRGHKLIELREPYGNMQAILWDRGLGVVRAASDPRGEGRARIETVKGVRALNTLPARRKMEVVLRALTPFTRTAVVRWRRAPRATGRGRRLSRSPRSAPGCGRRRWPN